MSVLIPKIKVFQYIHSGFVMSANTKDATVWLSAVVSRHLHNKLWDVELNRLMLNLIRLNVLTYCERYSERVSQFDLTPFWQVDLHAVEPVQVIRYIEAVLYNIELETVAKIGTAFENLDLITDQDRSDIKLLELYLQELRANYIQTLPDYGKANYCD